MSRLDALPADQRAALALLLGQRKSYAELAAMLAIPERAVRDRAHAALAVLAPREARELTPERRAQIGDYLLGQLPGVPERLAARTYVSGSAAAQAWAGALVQELAPLASSPLPEIPAGPPPAGAGPSLAERAAAPQLAGAPAGAGSSLPSSRVGGAALLAVIVVAIVIAVILISGGGSHSKTSSTASTSASKTSTTSGPVVDARLTLHSPHPHSRSIGAMDIISEGSKRAFYIEAENIPASKGFYYALWLFNNHSSFLPLSKAPPVGADKRLAGGALLPAEAGDYHEVLLTRETSARPTSPGPVVLRGPFSLG